MKFLQTFAILEIMDGVNGRKVVQKNIVKAHLTPPMKPKSYENGDNRRLYDHRRVLGATTKNTFEV